MSTGAGFKDDQNQVVDFGRTAVDYERHRPGFPESFFDHLLRRKWIAAGQRVLDLGTGTGSLALGLAARGLEVTGLDIAHELLEVARRTAADRALPARFVEGRAEATGQNDATFDNVSAGQCWWWFDADAAIREARRVLVPSGRLLICNFSYLPLTGTVAGCTEDLILRHNPGWPMAGWRGIHPEQVEALDRGGFRHVESFSYVVDVPFSHVGWRGRIRTCNGVGSALSDEQVELFDADLAELLARDFPGEIRVPHRVFATSGIMACLPPSGGP
jgi:ubiquinone/menaquinone biosynthesis C-methylase UbiE